MVYVIFCRVFHTYTNKYKPSLQLQLKRAAPDWVSYWFGVMNKSHPLLRPSALHHRLFFVAQSKVDLSITQWTECTENAAENFLRAKHSPFLSRLLKTTFVTVHSYSPPPPCLSSLASSVLAVNRSSCHPTFPWGKLMATPRDPDAHTHTHTHLVVYVSFLRQLVEER